MSAHDRSGGDGFTLVELIIVTAIISILAAIALPTFLGQVSAAQDTAAQSLVRHALTTERAYQIDHGTYTANRRALDAYEPNIAWNQRSNPADTVRVRLRGRFAETEVCLYTRSKTGTWFAIYHSDGKTLFGEPDRLRGCNPRVARNWSPDGW